MMRNVKANSSGPVSAVPIDTGTEEPVVLLHSSASSNAQWRTLSAVLEPRFQVIAPDLYGYGSTSAWPGQRPLTLADEAALIDRALSRGSDPVHLVGHSYGGAVALRAALENPDRIRSLTLIEPVAFYLLQNQHAADRPLLDEIQAVAEGVWRAVTCGEYWTGMAQFVDYWNGAGSWQALKESTQRTLAPQIVKVAMDFAATFRETTRLEEYRALTAPTLILYGDRTAAPTRRIVTLLSDALPNTRIESIAGAGHMAPLTHGGVVNTAIAEHLGRATQRDATARDTAMPHGAAPVGSLRPFLQDASR